MELREYWHIMWKRIWIPLFLVIVVGCVSFFTVETPPPTYTSSLRFVVSIKPEQVTDAFNYDGYYAGIASEFVADDLSVIVGSQAFAEDVNHHLAELGYTLQIPPGILSGVTFAEKQHRILQVNMSWGNATELAVIGAGVAQAIEQEGGKYLAQLGTFGYLVTVIDPPSPPTAVPASLTQRLDLPLRFILAIVAGVGLAFLINYLDTSVRNSNELEALNIPVLAEIPRK